jgi:hypothetical protein
MAPGLHREWSGKYHPSMLTSTFEKNYTPNQCVLWEIDISYSATQVGTIHTGPPKFPTDFLLSHFPFCLLSLPKPLVEFVPSRPPQGHDQGWPIWGFPVHLQAAKSPAFFLAFCWYLFRVIQYSALPGPLHMPVSWHDMESHLSFTHFCFPNP